MAKRTSKYLTNDRQMFEAIKFAEVTPDNSQTIAKLKIALKKVIDGELTPRQKEYLMLYYYEDLDMTQIADMYGVNISTVSRTIRRASANIKKYLKYLL